MDASKRGADAAAHEAMDGGADESGGDAGAESLDPMGPSGIDAGVPDAMTLEMPDAGPCGGDAPTYCYEDADGDGFAASGGAVEVQCEACGEGWTSLEPTGADVDCSDSSSDVFPGAAERCNDISDDCDAVVDEGASAACAYANAAGVCRGGQCEMGACAEPFHDCDENPDNGCEQTLDQVEHCGGCGVACDSAATCIERDGGHACRCDSPLVGDGRDCIGRGPFALGNGSSCGITNGGTLECWGSGITSPPAGTYKSLAGGWSHYCTLTGDGGVDCWGADESDQSGPHPVGPGFVQVVTGRAHSCALDGDGQVLCWGADLEKDKFGQTAVPDGLIARQLAAGDAHTCAIDLDDQVVCWGAGKIRDGNCGGTSNHCGQSDPPTGRFIQVTAGWMHTCGLRLDGTVACWGAGETKTKAAAEWGQSDPPTGTFTFIDAGWLHNCGVATDGTATCWGAGTDTVELLDRGQSAPPPGTVLRVYGGGLHSCALTNGLVAQCFGANDTGEANPPTHTWPLDP